MSALSSKFSEISSKISIKQYKQQQQIIPNQKFGLETEIKQIVQNYFNLYLQDYQYDETANQKADEISKCVFNQFIRRYKLICQSYIIQNIDQGIFVSINQLWNSEFDGVITEKFNGKDFTCIFIAWYCYIE